MSNDLGKTLADIFADKYTIPLYQRNFAWRTEEIHQLLQDIHEACRENSVGNYYIGSLVVMKRHNGYYEVIDGQQRLTVVSLIAILLGKLSSPVLFYDSRPEVQEFFKLLCKDPGKQEDALRLTAPSLFYLKEAYEFLKTAKPDFPDGTEEITQYLADPQFAEFFLNHVILVRNEIPEDTDVAAYFEIMNNRGEQLQKHEIVKAQMMDKIKVRCSDGTESHETVRQGQFAKIWEACARMDIPIHRLFPAKDRERFFGKQYDGFLHDCFVPVGVVIEPGERKRSYSLADILGGKINGAVEKVAECEEGTETDIYAYSSIIDFPNFLMHVLRLYCNVNKVNVKIHGKNAQVPLNEKELLSIYRENGNQIDSMKFIELLLFCRAVFDRFIVKTTEDASDQEDGRKWILLKPVKPVKPAKYDSNWKFTPSFDGEKGRQLVVAISMLQVTFRTRIYKTWLYDAFKWFYEKCWETGNFGGVSADEYLGFLNGWMLDYYDKQKFNVTRVLDEEPLSPSNSYSLGTDTPHFLLNFIDYLYWCKFIKEGQPKIRNFDFKYWNSVEHHLAQNKVDDNCQYIDNLGNLCLVSKSSNSRLSDRDVKEKVDVYGHGNLGPNRQIIYNTTKESLWYWGETQIRTHYNELVEMLDNRVSLLKGAVENVDIQIEQLREFITQKLFDCPLPNGYELKVAEGEDAELQNKWCGRYFYLSKPNGEMIKCWVGWRYGGTDKVAYGRQIDFSVEPSFAIQVPVDGLGIPGDSWYKTIWIGKWWNKELSFDIHNRDLLAKTAEEFKAEILRLCAFLL